MVMSVPTASSRVDGDHVQRGPSRRVSIDPAAVDRVIASIDTRIAHQLDAIFSHPAFQALERSWRGLAYLVACTTFENVRIDILPCTKEELRASFEEASSVPESALYALVYTPAFVPAAGAPYAAILADFVFEPEESDLALLLSVAMVGALAHAPFVAAASPRFLGAERFPDVPERDDVPLPLGPRAFAALREREEARYLGLVLPRFLLRAPHRVSLGGVAYEESAQDHEARCWGSAVYAFGARLTDSFVRYGWCPNIVGPTGGGLVEGLPEMAPRGEAAASAIPTELPVSARREQDLSEAGFIPLAARPGEAGACFWSASSVLKPKWFGESEEQRAAEMNFRLSTQLPYVFLAARIAHYMKVIYRDNVEAKIDRADVEMGLNVWMDQYSAGREVLTPATRRRQVLRRVRILVSEANQRWYEFNLQMRPIFKHMGAFYTLRVVGKLDKP
jgi:type VI secretion system protein ImpC